MTRSGPPCGQAGHHRFLPRRDWTRYAPVCWADKLPSRKGMAWRGVAGRGLAQLMQAAGTVVTEGNLFFFNPLM